MTRRARRQRSIWVNALLFSMAVVIFVTLLGLGFWQLERRTWKLDLIDAVETRTRIDPVAPPEAGTLSEDHAYLRVAVSGQFRHDLSRRVKAITELGPGHWVLAPLQTAEGHVWVNRGFVPVGMEAGAWTLPQGPVAIEGLLRISEPDGTLLESNDPAGNRWVSRDVDALSEQTGLTDAPLYFIDADHTGTPDAWPRGGLTILHFNNPHLSYALTWFGMAALLFGGVAYVVSFRLYAR